MLTTRRPWREELEIIDKTMKAISSISDPEELVDVYWAGIGELMPIRHYVTASRRGETPPNYLVTRSSRFSEHFNPWTQRHRLPRLRGGLLGEICYANAPVIIDDLPSRLAADDPAHFYLQGFASLVAFPQYDGGESLNVTVMLLEKGFTIDPMAIPVLHWQSGLFGRGTQNLVLKNQLTRALGALDRELQTVGEIQRSLLPAELPAIPGFELAAHYLTSARAGGDYYDFFPLAGGAWGIFIADVSGHGTPAAVLMAITHAIAHSKPGMHTPPASLLDFLNARLARSYTRTGTFVTAFYAVLDPVARTLTYSAAGHNPPRLARQGRMISLDGAGSLPLGITPDQTYTEETIGLESGDLLLLYTDGITEAMAPPGPEGQRAQLGMSGLDRVLQACGGVPAAECIARVMNAVTEFSAAAPPTDDQTLIALRCM
ncbi:MAG: PP2C family protein-serine/threonine phosphatase [Phycisphaerales bacterium]